MIGLLGGSFDPIHFGHLRPALELYEDLKLQEVRLIPSGLPPHRTPPLTSAEQRLAMVQAAITGVPGLCVDERELHRAGPSYTVDTLHSLRAELGQTPLCLIVGMDAFLGLDTWRRWRELIQLAHIVLAHRPGWAASGTGEVAELLAERRVEEPQMLASHAAGHILCWPVTQLDISSSRIRTLLAEGKSARYLLPDDVLAIINAHGIYRSNTTERATNERT